MRLKLAGKIFLLRFLKFLKILRSEHEKLNQMNIEQIFRSIYYDEEITKVNSLIESLMDISGKPLKVKMVRQYVFKTTWKKREIELRARCQVKAAVEYLKFLTLGERRPDIDLIKVAIVELKYPLMDLGRSNDLPFILGSTNTNPSTIHYKHMKDLFYHRDLASDSKSNYQADLLILYGTRLALESRIRRLLGIDSVTSKNRQIGLTDLIHLSENLEHVQYKSGIDWTEIKWVVLWLNHHMHRHLRPNPWTIHQAFQILDHLIEQSSHSEGDRTTYSFYASTVVQHENLLEQEIERKLRAKFEDVNIEWTSNKERLKIRKN